MQGYLIVNEYATIDSFCAVFDSLLQAAKDRGIGLRRFTNGQMWQMLFQRDYRLESTAAFPEGETILSEDECGLPEGEAVLPEKECGRPDFVLFWDKDIKLAARLETLGIPVFNSARAIQVCDNKAETYLALVDSGIAMPRTFIAPKMYYGIDDASGYLRAGETLGYPLILKECYGSFGEQVSLISDPTSLENAVKAMGSREFLLQEYIASSKGRDLRLYVVGDRVVAAMERRNDRDFRANIAAGGSSYPVELTEAQIDMALKAVKVLGLDFAGVDLLFGADGSPVLCEVNSNAQFGALKKCTGADPAESILEYIAGKVRK